jgi:uncharacterized protein
MLRLDLTALRAGPVEVSGSVAPDAPVFGGLDFRVDEPVVVRGRLTDSGHGQYYMQATLTTLVLCACRRCLTDIRFDVKADIQVMFTDDQETDDSAAYMIPARAAQIELDEMVREQLILAVPNFLECRASCRGLCARCGNDLNDGPCDCQPEPDPRWAVLEALKSAGDDKES